MLKLNMPTLTPRKAFDLCKDGIGISELKKRFNEGIGNLCLLADEYQSKAIEGELFKIPPLPKNIDHDFVVAGNLTKSELTNLYEYYLREKEKPGRIIYDTLMVSAKEKCPFCGGIGRPKNLDHFIPKAFFPQFSIIPLNLIPSCRDCNMDGKGQAFASVASEQIIHPYLDKSIFFTQKWVYAKIETYDPCSIEYFVYPPDNWIPVDKERVTTHFHNFELSKRYSIQAAEELSILIDQRKGIMKKFSPDEFREYLSSFTNSPIFINHWKKVMYHCLANDEEFCNYVF